MKIPLTLIHRDGRYVSNFLISVIHERKKDGRKKLWLDYFIKIQKNKHEIYLCIGRRNKWCIQTFHGFRWRHEILCWDRFYQGANGCISTLLGYKVQVEAHFQKLTCILNKKGRFNLFSSTSGGIQ